mmetsp:Transcript_88462/g.223413  ORF Transcript_88462/g.223413 Transcript_88462/m.223413 type:complete len:209 (+) Transcript_88462:794-1420(+)
MLVACLSTDTSICCAADCLCASMAATASLLAVATRLRECLPIAAAVTAACWGEHLVPPVHRSCNAAAFSQAVSCNSERHACKPFQCLWIALSSTDFRASCVSSAAAKASSSKVCATVTARESSCDQECIMWRSSSPDQAATRCNASRSALSTSAVRTASDPVTSSRQSAMAPSNCAWWLLTNFSAASWLACSLLKVIAITSSCMASSD